MYLYFGICIVLSAILFVIGNHMDLGRGRAFAHHACSMLAGGVIAPAGIMALAGASEGPLIYAGRVGIFFLALFVGFLPALFRKEV